MQNDFSNTFCGQPPQIGAGCGPGTVPHAAHGPSRVMKKKKQAGPDRGQTRRRQSGRTPHIDVTPKANIVLVNVGFRMTTFAKAASRGEAGPDGGQTRLAVASPFLFMLLAIKDKLTDL